MSRRYCWLLAATAAQAEGAPLRLLVDNRSGAGGQLAAQALKAASPGGNTVFLTHDHTISILPQVHKNLGFDPARDFVAVASVATFVNALAVSGSTTARSLPAYVAWVRNQNGGHGNVGVPAPASVPDLIENHRTGKLHVIAVMGASGLGLLPGVTTFVEPGLAGFEESAYYGFFAPVATPPVALKRFAAALSKVLAMPGRV